MNSPKKAVTHNSTFHADDVFATATLSLLFGDDISFTRTRDADIIAGADIVYDVGGIHDPEKDRFDHHQPGRAGERENGIPYASFGLVWKKYGEQLCGSKEIANALDKRLVQAIDAPDNGINLFDLTREVVPYLFSSGLYTFRPTWKEDASTVDAGFFDAVAIAEKVLARAIIHTRDALEAEKAVAIAYEQSEDKRYLVLGERYPWEEITVSYPEELLYVITPRINDGKWKAEGLLKKLGSMERRAYFPESWGGKYYQELAEVTGVAGSVFCHLGRFMVTAETKEDVIKLVKIALSDSL